MEGWTMNTLEKLIYCKEHGISISYIANRLELAPATLTKWIRGEKGITNRNERLIEQTLRQFAQELWENVGDNNDRNL